LVTRAFLAARVLSAMDPCWKPEQAANFLFADRRSVNKCTFTERLQLTFYDCCGLIEALDVAQSLRPKFHK